MIGARMHCLLKCVHDALYIQTLLIKQEVIYNLTTLAMQGERDIKANILIQIDNTVMHRFVNKDKALFTSGTCKVAKIDNPNQNVVYFINLNSFYYTLNKSITFAKIEYDDTVSYLFAHFDNGLSSLTMIKNSQTIHNFEEILSNAAVLLPFDQAIQNPDFKTKVDEHCPGIQKQPIHGADKIKSTIKEAGKILGAGFKVIGSYLAQGVQYVGQFIDKKVQQPGQKTEVAPQTKQKWETLKKGTSNVIDVSKDLYTKYLAPVVEVGLEYGKQVVTKIQSSDNSAVKYARQLASTSGQALGTAVKGLAQGTSEVSTQLGTQSRKIVNKKYGEDYVKTFLPDGTEKKEEHKDDKEQTPTERPLKQTEQSLREPETQEHKPLYPNLQKHEYKTGENHDEKKE